MSNVLAEKQASMKERHKERTRRFSVRTVRKLCNRCTKALGEGEKRFCAPCAQIEEGLYSLWEETMIHRKYGHGLVYFLQSDMGGPIKIGYTLKLAITRRIKELQTGNPYPLRFIGVINNATKSLERELHEKFASCRLCGEWFLDTPELLSYIQKHAIIRSTE